VLALRAHSALGESGGLRIRTTHARRATTLH
jgi:hypothetical protein